MCIHNSTGIPRDLLELNMEELDKLDIQLRNDWVVFYRLARQEIQDFMRPGQGSFSPSREFWRLLKKLKEQMNGQRCPIAQLELFFPK